MSSLNAKLLSESHEMRYEFEWTKSASTASKSPPPSADYAPTFSPNSHARI